MMDNYEILFVEDSLADASYYISLIEEIHGENLNITHVRKFSQFEKISSRKKFHLLLLDINLPDSNGIDTIKRVRDIEQKSPIIVLTGNTSRGMASSALTYGANDYLVKGQDDDKITKKMIEFWLRFSEKVYA